WASGQALLAEFTRAEDAPDALVRARKLALEGAEAYPDSPGGRRCLHVARGIEAPDFSVEMMAADAPGRRSVRFMHRNLAAVFLRAYPVDLAGCIRTSKDYNLFPQWNEARDIIEKSRPAASWKLDLPATPDFRDHRSYVELPSGLAPGLYLVAASARNDFARNANRIRALNVVVGDLVMLRRASGEGGTDAVVLSGGTGRPVAGASVDLYAFDWQKGHTRMETKVTDAEGRVHFAPRSEGQGPFFLLAAKDRDLAIDPDYMYLYAGSKPAETSAALIYTDRSIYRPGQKLYWKILVYRGRGDLGKLRPAANAGASIWLEDINGQRVAGATCALNGFGTASGEFVIPDAGRPLGAWRLRTSPEGFAQVRVEEYKRPTFEVTVKDPDKPLRLNRPATLKGEARYYFGLPVASGAAVWQVKRERVYPRWWWWEAPDSGSSQVVAGGKVPLHEDGTVEVTFTPRVDERGGGPGSGLTYRYTLSVDVTDEGGETRTATRSFRLGFVSVEAAIAAANGFGRIDTRSAFTITRADLNGTPKAGKGSWRVVRLLQPETTLLPADQPLPDLPMPERRKAFRTAGDRLRPRWESPLAPENILRLWKEGPEAARGAAEHGADGRAAVSVQALEAGAYRMIYETKDDFGAVCRDSLDFLVSGLKASARLPLLLVAETASVPVGGTAR
ncbi:MAG TPA: MG2 domain-containing protein, partial [Acidobacteriota bacterium]|nr:MG2 domain-containing protein [Acidobacteriota bacterium]